MSQKAALRCCASCCWIFKNKKHPTTGGCPKCGWPSYGARYVFGARAYRFAISQQPWINKQTDKARAEAYRTSEFRTERP